MNITVSKAGKTITLPGKKDFLQCIIIAVLTQARTVGISPFGTAMAATAENPVMAFVGLALGVAGTGIGAVKYISAFFIYSVFVFVKNEKRKDTRAVILGISLVVSRGLELFYAGITFQNILMIVPEAAVAGGAYMLFSCIGNEGEKARYGELLLAGAILNGLGGIAEFPYAQINISVIAAFFIYMSLCYSLEMPKAVLASVVIGFVMNMNGSDAIAETGAAAVAAVIACSLSGMGKMGTAVGFLCGITTASLFRGSLGGIQPVDIFIPVAVFMILPEAMHMRCANFIGARFEDEIKAEERMNMRVAGQLKTMARAVCELADGVRVLPGKNKKEAALSEMFGSISSRVCKGCSLEKNCLQKDCRKTYKNMYDLWQTMETDGYCDYSNMPQGFKQVCMRAERILTEFNHVYELYKQNMLLKGEALSGRGIMARQYGEISGIINGLSREIEEGTAQREAPPAKYRVEISIACEPKPGQAVCGDTVLHFEKDEKYYVILCDGMGSGEAALSESKLTADLFYEFLNAGLKKETALEMINSSLAMKTDRESFSTADIFELDLRTGEAEFLKIGSAKSFIKTKSTVSEVCSKALPVGILENTDAKPQSFDLKSGYIVLMMSDGVGEAGSGVLKNEWIKKILTSPPCSDEELVKLIIAGAKIRTKFSDDMTCAVIRIKRRKDGYESGE